jgi:acetyl/propionyl-CoA carboxylase alpha subunit
MSGVQRLAIVNRGEPAMRCLAAVGELGDEFGEPITTIALYTDPDAASLFVRQADEAVSLGPALITDPDGSRHGAYVDIDKVMAALAQVRADSVWTGWGFLAESADFAARCEEAGITFVGPSSDVIRLLGDKVRAKQLAESVGVPVVPWSGGPVHDGQSAQLAAGMLGYPVLVKAAAGGGGRGIRLVESESAMLAAVTSAQREAQAATRPYSSNEKSNERGTSRCR